MLSTGVVLFGGNTSNESTGLFSKRVQVFTFISPLNGYSENKYNTLPYNNQVSQREKDRCAATVFLPEMKYNYEKRKESFDFCSPDILSRRASGQSAEIIYEGESVI